MLVVTGTQRSGTSLIARALKESGYDLGATWYDEEVRGGLDNDWICGFYQQYLGDPTFPFDDRNWPVVEPGQFAAMDYKVVKFCYLLMSPAFVSIWHKFRPKGDTFLVMNRNKEHVMQSKLRLRERFKHDSLLLGQSDVELFGNFDMSVYLLRMLGYQYETLYFPECIYDMIGINKKLARLDPSVQIKSEVWARIFDPSKIHFK